MPRITGDVAGVRLVTNDLDDRCTRLGYGAGSAPYEHGADQQRLADAIEAMLHIPVRGFQGSYSAASFTLDARATQSE